MKNYLKKAIVILAALILSAAFCPLPSDVAFSAAEEGEDFTLSAQGDTIEVTVPSFAAGGTLIRFRANAYHPSESFIPLYDGKGDDNTEDGYSSDREYYSADQGGFLEIRNVKAGKTRIERYSRLSGENGHDKIFDRFYVVKNDREEDGVSYGGEVVCGGQFVTEFDSLRNYARRTPSSIKGLEVVNAYDAERIGIRHGTVGLDVNTIMLGKDGPDAETFSFDGNVYYFSKKNLKENDRKIKEMSDAGISVTQSLLIYADHIGAESVLAHPDFKKLEDFPMNMSGINTTTVKSIDVLAATCAFLADRYTREDGLYGHVDNFTVGNEAESACQWNNMGYLPADEYARQYERAVRIAYTAIKSVWSGANVFACFSHFWNVDVATQYMNYYPEAYAPFLGHGSYTTRELLNLLAGITAREGNYLWQLAYHPYRANAIGEAVFWDAVNHIASSHDELTASKVTPLNIDVLADFLKKDELTCNGTVRDYYVTEYGAGTPHGSLSSDGYSPEKITEKALNEQAASYIYSYYLFYFNGAKSYVLHRHIDAAYEDGENLGIWMRKEKSEEEPYVPKPVYEVMKYIDTEKSLYYTTPYLKYIRTYPEGKTPSSWAEIVPGFDADLLESSPVCEQRPLERTDDYENNAVNTGFEDGKADGWRACDNAGEATVLSSPLVAKTGNAGLVVRYQSTASAGRGLAEKGILKEFPQGEDLTVYDAFRFSVNVDNNDAEGSVQTISVKFISGERSVEYTASAERGKYNCFSVKTDKNDWQYFDSVEKIKIRHCSTDAEASGGILYFDDVGFSVGDGTKPDVKKGCKGNVRTEAYGTIALLGVLFPAMKKRKGVA